MSALGNDEKWGLVVRSVSHQDPSSIPPELSTAPSTRSPDWPLWSKDAWGLGSLLLALPGAAALRKAAQWKDLRSPTASSRPNPATLKDAKAFKDRSATSILVKLSQLRRDESKEKQLFTYGVVRRKQSSCFGYN